MNAYHKTMEKFWLGVAILSLVFAVYKMGQLGLSESLTYFLFPAIAGSLFYARYFIRKRAERESNNDQDQ
jgi:membrane protease YdiL (CAAX protease family)